MTMNRLRCALEVKFDDAAAQAGTFTGYGAVFGNLDAYGDTIQKGAFKATLKDWRKRRGKLPPMLLQHGGWMMTDDDGVPIGKWTAMEEDDKGLRVEGRLINLDTDQGKRVYGAMREGVLDGLSIGYMVKEAIQGTKPEEPRRTLKAVDLWEVSVVTFPANDEARVGAVKSANQWTEREIEHALRDAGVPRALAVAVATHGAKKALADLRDADGGLAELRALVERRGDAITNLNR